MTRIRSVILAVLFVLLSSSMTIATPMDYTALGVVMDQQGNMLPIIGSVNIDNQLRDWAPIGPGQPTELPEGWGLYVFQYYISDYSLQVGQNSFSGDSGSLYLQLGRFSPSEDWFTGDLMWFLEDGQGAWTTWIGEDFVFYNSDLTLQEASQYGTLAEVINFVALSYLFNDPILSVSPPFSMWLIQKDGAAPAPEPSTMALLGASAIGMLLHKRRTSRRRAEAS